RIAAQTAKQVLLQRVREAEREHLYEDFSGREGELVNGTVQSISGQHITIGLGRTEAILPKSHQVPGERYRAHDKIRVYVLEVRRTNRGPQIFVSRNHRNLLRRLLELEVPEIYNGQVEIKSIAREAGQRSKVAVQALQPGVDPVGACVGMRGVRIQSIVRELNDEKIDVIEWDPDQHVFIAKALSPARVSQVFLEEHPDEGKTAIVIVPDDQLSLAIGREGQNARLAAKLTGWRIDIKSLTEAAGEALGNLNHPAVPDSVRKNQNLVELAQIILDKKAASRPITSEDYHTLDRMVSLVEGGIVASRAREYERVRKQRALARRNVPQVTWQLPLDELDLPGRIHNLLLDNNVETVGDVLYQLSLGDEVVLGFKGFGQKMLDTLKEMTADYMATLDAQPAAETAAPAEAAPAVAEAETVAAEAAVPAAAEVEAEPALAAVEETAVAEAEPVVETAVGEPEAEPVAAVEEMAVEAAVEVEAEAAAEVAEEAPPIPEIDDLSRSLVEEVVEEEEEEEAPAPVVIVRPVSKSDEDDDEEARRRGRKGRELVFDEDMGEVVVKRKRKGSRRRPAWEDYDIEDEF
ncbi:MAG: transcription termination/antitermination protein NusA, partial [Caldilineaceae bacterium]|nr:transcription termination/antitermination protein NusA [Caldilineaceae bacterium]